MLNVDSKTAKAMFEEAVNLVAQNYPGRDASDLDYAHHSLLWSTLFLLKEYTASSNSIPALGSLGLEEGLDLAQKVIDTGGKVNAIKVHYRHIAKGFLAN